MWLFNYLKMVSSIHIFPIVLLLFIKGCLTETKYCLEAINSIKNVDYCPTSKEEWDKAANEKNCWIKASQQNCTSAENFVYHCVINGHNNAFFEVCAPQRVILGHCTEFNDLGGVIQDQSQSLCNDHFPKCDEYYNSSDAYKYEDCYKLVQKKMDISTSLTPPEYNATSRDTADRNNTSAIIFGLASGITAIAIVITVIFFLKRRWDDYRNDRQKRQHEDQNIDEANPCLENQKDKTQERQSKDENDLKLNDKCRNDRRKGHYEVKNIDETNSCLENKKNITQEGQSEIEKDFKFNNGYKNDRREDKRLTSPPSSPKAVLSSKSSGSSLSYLTPPVSPREYRCHLDDKFTFNQ